MAFDTAGSSPSSGRVIDSAPPRPPSRQSVIQIGMNPTNPGVGGPPNMGAMGADPSSALMMKMANVRNALFELSAALPPLAPGVQQFLTALEQTVPQMMADLVSGQPPGMGGAGGQGAALANQAPTAPPTSTGLP